MVIKNIYIYIYIQRTVWSIPLSVLAFGVRFLKDRYGVMGWIQRRICKMSGSFQMPNRYNIVTDKIISILYIIIYCTLPQW